MLSFGGAWLQARPAVPSKHGVGRAISNSFLSTPCDWEGQVGQAWGTGRSEGQGWSQVQQWASRGVVCTSYMAYAYCSCELLKTNGNRLV